MMMPPSMMVQMPDRRAILVEQGEAEEPSAAPIDNH